MPLLPYASCTSRAEASFHPPRHRSAGVVRCDRESIPQREAPSLSSSARLRFPLAAIGFGTVMLQRRRQSFTSFTPKGPHRCRGTWLARRALMEEDDGKAELQSFAVTLLNRLASGKGVEAAHAVADEDGTIDVAEFRQLLRRLRIDCEESDAETLFRMVDSNSEGRVPVAELRNRLRESESIQDMYTSGLNGVLITLIPTVALGLAFAFLDSPGASLDSSTVTSLRIRSLWTTCSCS
mmetsp:Transcript_53476/g.127520  ORF Transcript_53476/g.127520 Transcript_53476/m.127520 type:complete len:238 (+) Transcript_53476:142-855(+)